MLRKAVFAIMILVLVVSIPICSKASSEEIEIYINGQKVESDVPPIIVNDRTLAPVRVISEYMGAEVKWDGKNRLVHIITREKNIILKIDDKKVLVNDQEIFLDVPAIIVDNRTMVPIRFLSETLGADVGWDNELRRVLINTKESKIIGFSYDMSNGIPTVVIQGDGELGYDIFETQDDNIIAIDIKARLDTTQNALYINDSYIKKAVVGQISNEPLVTRVVLELKPEVSFRIQSSADKESIYIIFDNSLEDVVLESLGRELMVKLQTTNPANINYFFLSEPDRLVVDINDALLSEIEAPEIPENEFVENIRFGQFSENTVRIVFDLKDDVNYRVEKMDNIFSVIFSDVKTINDIKLIKEDNLTVVEIAAEGEIGYKLEADKDKRQLKIILFGAVIGDNLYENLKEIEDSIVESIEVVKVKDEKNYNLELVLNLNAFSGYEMLTSSPSSIIKLAVHDLPLKDKLIVIDPGHGGSDPGAIIDGINEKDLNLDIGLKLKKLLEQNGAKVFMTREEDVYVDIYTRAQMANEIGADLFVSIHNNSASSGASGTETLYFPDPEKKLFAQTLQNAIIEFTGQYNRGIIERPGIVVTRETKMPSALVEAAFMTNKNDLAKLMTEEFRYKIAQGILKGITDYLREKLN